MSKKNRNSNAAKREKRVQHLVTLLAAADQLNKAAIETRVRKQLSKPIAGSVTKDRFNCLKLLQGPFPEPGDLDYLARNGEPRVKLVAIHDPTNRLVIY